MTTWEALAHVIGPEWAAKLWPVVRDRPGLIAEIAEIAPRYAVRVRGDGHSELYDVAAGYREAWISARAAEFDKTRHVA